MYSDILTMGVSIIVYFGVIFCFVVIGAIFVNTVNAFRDAKRFKAENKMLHARLDLVSLENIELQNQIATLIGDLQRKTVADNWVRTCATDDYMAKQKKAETVIKNYRKQIEGGAKK